MRARARVVLNCESQEATISTQPEKDYLAVISVSGAGSWARGPDKEKQIKRVLRLFKQDFKNYFKLEKGKEVHIDVLDVTDHETVTWDDFGFHSKSKAPLGPVERVVRTL
jgi:hypothetical protein